MAKAERREIYYFDETSLALWSPILRKTWSDGRIKLPLQTHRGENRTILGAVGGDPARNKVRFIHQVSRATNNDTVAEYMRDFYPKAN